MSHYIGLKSAGVICRRRGLHEKHKRYVFAFKKKHFEVKATILIIFKGRLSSEETDGDLTSLHSFRNLPES